MGSNTFAAVKPDIIAKTLILNKPQTQLGVWLWLGMWYRCKAIIARKGSFFRLVGRNFRKNLNQRLSIFVFVGRERERIPRETRVYTLGQFRGHSAELFVHL